MQKGYKSRGLATSEFVVFKQEQDIQQRACEQSSHPDQHGFTWHDNGFHSYSDIH